MKSLLWSIATSLGLGQQPAAQPAAAGTAGCLDLGALGRELFDLWPEPLFRLLVPKVIFCGVI
jgi:hypothetical protein